MELFTFLIIALTFYALGRYNGREVETYRKVSKVIKRKMSPPQTGVIEYPTPEQVEYTGSEEERVDQERERVFKESFKPKL